MTGSDPSGMMRFLTDQLQEAEDANDRGGSIVLFVLKTTAWILIIICSLDYWPCTFWMERSRSIAESIQSL